MNGFNISFSPTFLEGLTLGATKICISKWGKDFIKYLNPFYSQNNYQPGDSGEDQKASIYYNWDFIPVQFSCYGEYGFDDYSAEPYANPFHTGIYTIGLRKNFFHKKSNLESELLIEINNFEMSQDFQLQWNYQGFYSHGKITQGYTQKGQIIGAGSCFFGNSQYISYKLYYEKGFYKIFLHRFSPDMNYTYNKAINYPTEYCEKNFYGCIKTFFTAGFESFFFFKSNLSILNSIYLTDIIFPFYTFKSYIENVYNPNIHVAFTLKYNI